MYNMSYKLTKQQKEEQSIKYTADMLLNFLEANNKKQIIFSSSLKQEYMSNTYYKLLKNFPKDKKIRFMTSQRNIEKLIDDSNKQVIKQSFDLNELNTLLSNQDEFDYTVIVIPPINLFKEGIKLVKEVGAIILFEKYGISTYENFEEELALIKENDIEHYAVVPIK